MPRDKTRGVLQVNQLSKDFGSHAVLDGVSFSLGPGTLTCLSGGNGAGKSTSIRCLTGLTRFRGSARLDGIRLPDGARARRWIGYVPQDPALQEGVTVEETVRFFVRLQNVEPRGGFLPRDFLPPGGRRVGTLSGGQRQRLAFRHGGSPARPWPSGPEPWR